LGLRELHDNSSILIGSLTKQKSNLPASIGSEQGEPTGDIAHRHMVRYKKCKRSRGKLGQEGKA
jgi:hypothetical protein